MMKGVDGVGSKGCQEVDEGEAHLFEINVMACDGAAGGTGFCWIAMVHNDSLRFLAATWPLTACHSGKSKISLHTNRRVQKWRGRRASGATAKARRHPQSNPGASTDVLKPLNLRQISAQQYLVRSILD